MLEGVWLAGTLGVSTGGEVLWGVEDPRIRAAAIRMIGRNYGRIADPVRRRTFNTMLRDAVVDDSHPRVRLEAVRALGNIPEVWAARLAMRVLDKPMDKFLEYGLWLTARELEPIWGAELRAGR